MNEEIKVALVTGASRRIGAEIVRVLHGAGYGIALHFHRSEAAAEALAAELNARRAGSVQLLRARLDDWFGRYVTPHFDGSRETVTGSGQLGPIGPARKPGLAFEEGRIAHLVRGP